MVEDEEEARVRVLRETLEQRIGPSMYKQLLLVDLIKTYLPIPESERERYEELISRGEYREVGEFERSWTERLMLHGVFEGKRQTLKRQLTTKFGQLPPWIESRIDAIADERELDAYLDRVLTASTLAELGLAD